MRTAVFLWLFRLWARGARIFANSAHYLTTAPQARSSTQSELHPPLAQGRARRATGETELLCLASCQGSQVASIHFTICSIVHAGHSEKALRSSQSLWWRIKKKTKKKWQQRLTGSLLEAWVHGEVARASKRISLGPRAFLCEFGVKPRLMTGYFLPLGR